MKKLITLILPIFLAGCVVAPVAPVDPRVRIEPQIIVELPTYPYTGYQLDSRVNLYFFWYQGQRYYMPRGWNPNYHRPFRGKYRGEKRGFDWYHR